MRNQVFFRERPKKIIVDSEPQEFSCQLGKIGFIKLGNVYDRDFLLGLQMGFDIGNGGVVCTDISVNMSEHCPYTDNIERMYAYANILQIVYDMLKDSKKQSLDELKNVPVELFFTGRGLCGDLLIGFRILKEVL